ncbi:hypothetical protein GF373_15830 [bacterium]|nr:hypothetical protein [bacterium]
MVKYPTVGLRIRILGLEGEMHKMKKRMREIEFVDTSSIPAEQFPSSE